MQDLIGIGVPDPSHERLVPKGALDLLVAGVQQLDEALEIKNTQIAEELALPPVKIHCSILAEDAIKAAVNDYKAKHAS